MVIRPCTTGLDAVGVVHAVELDPVHHFLVTLEAIWVGQVAAPFCSPRHPPLQPVDRRHPPPPKLLHNLAVLVPVLARVVVVVTDPTTVFPFPPGGNCIKIGLPGKSILRDYF